MLGRALSNKCFIMLLKEVPSLTLHDIRLSVLVRNYHDKLQPVSWSHLCTDCLFATILIYHLCLMSLFLAWHGMAFSIWISFSCLKTAFDKPKPLFQHSFFAIFGIKCILSADWKLMHDLFLIRTH